MDRLADYGAIVKRIFDGIAAQIPEDDEVVTERIYDEAKGHYELMRVGWRDTRRLHGIVLHADVRNGKVWIQHDGTEDGIADELLEAGIPKEHIVLAFHPPYKRPYTGFATA